MSRRAEQSGEKHPAHFLLAKGVAKLRPVSSLSLAGYRYRKKHPAHFLGQSEQDAAARDQCFPVLRMPARPPGEAGLSSALLAGDWDRAPTRRAGIAPRRINPCALAATRGSKGAGLRMVGPMGLTVWDRG